MEQLHEVYGVLTDSCIVLYVKGVKGVTIIFQTINKE